MHADEVDTDVDLVRRLISAQFPQWVGLTVEPVASRGTENVLYRLGDDMVVRLPNRERSVGTLLKERRWLPLLAPLLPLAVPVPLAAGRPGEGYPLEWSVYTWLHGDTASCEPITDLAEAAADLAGFVGALQRIDPSGGPAPGEHNSFRGVPLAMRDAAVRQSLAGLEDEIDAAAAAAAWDEALRAADWERPPVWIHGDLDARNVLVTRGRLSGVVDFGCLGVGDPACEVMVAWKLFSGPHRQQFRARLDVDDATWARSRGWALSQALIALAYYTPETNPELVAESRRWLAEVLGP